MKLYLLYDRIIKSTEKAHIVLFSLEVTNETTKDFNIVTSTKQNLCLSELPPDLQFTMVIPKSQSQLYDECVEITSWFYTKAVHEFQIKLNRDEFISFKQVYPLWLRKTLPVALDTPKNKDNDHSLDKFNYSEDDLRDFSHLY